VLAQGRRDAFAALNVGRRAFTARSITVLPTVCETICSTSKMGTPLRISDANVRVNRARQILWAIVPNTAV